MMRIILRTVADIVVFAISIPLRILVILWLIGYAIICMIKRTLMFGKNLKPFIADLKYSFQKDIDWLLTGEHSKD